MEERKKDRRKQHLRYRLVAAWVALMLLMGSAPITKAFGGENTLVQEQAELNNVPEEKDSPEERDIAEDDIAEDDIAEDDIKEGDAKQSSTEESDSTQEEIEKNNIEESGTIEDGIEEISIEESDAIAVPESADTILDSGEEASAVNNNLGVVGSGTVGKYSGLRWVVTDYMRQEGDKVVVPLIWEIEGKISSISVVGYIVGEDGMISGERISKTFTPSDPEFAHGCELEADYLEGPRTTGVGISQMGMRGTTRFYLAITATGVGGGRQGLTTDLELLTQKARGFLFTTTTQVDACVLDRVPYRTPASTVAGTIQYNKATGILSRRVKAPTWDSEIYVNMYYSTNTSASAPDTPILAGSERTISVPNTDKGTNYNSTTDRYVDTYNAGSNGLIGIYTHYLSGTHNANDHSVNIRTGKVNANGSQGAFSYKTFSNVHANFRRVSSGDSKMFLMQDKSMIANPVITYDANGGTGAPASQTVLPAEDTALSSEVPTRSGYRFRGWAESSTATTADYQPGDTVSITGNLTLYAVWTDKYTVTYDANYPIEPNIVNTEGMVPVDSTQYEEGDEPVVLGNTGSLAVTTNSVSGYEYTFEGWSRNKNGTVAEYAEGDSYHTTGSTGGITADATLYAIWSRKEISISKTLTVTNTVKGASPLFDENFSYTINLVAPAGSTLPENVDCVNSGDGSITSINLSTGGEGAFSLKPGANIAIQVPGTYTYKITQTAKAKYQTSNSVNGGPVEPSTTTGAHDMNGADATVEFINTRVTKELTVSNTVIDGPEGFNENFDYSIRLEAAAGDSLPGSVSCVNSGDGSATVVNLSGTGEGTFFLKPGANVVLQVPDDVTYTIVQTLKVGYRTQNRVNGGTLNLSLTAGPQAMNETDSTVEFINTKSYTLDLGKAVVGEFIDSTREFEFEITIVDKNNAELSDLSQIVKLKKDTNIIISSIPSGAKITIEETAVSGYVASYVINNDEGSKVAGTVLLDLVMNEDKKVLCTNESDIVVTGVNTQGNNSWPMVMIGLIVILVLGGGVALRVHLWKRKED